MAFKDRMRRALGKSSSQSTTPTSSTSTSSNTSSTNLDLANVLTFTPTNVPSITLTKTSTRLSKMTSWRSSRYKEPKGRSPFRNTEHHQMLKGFEMKFGKEGRPSMDGQRSVFSGVSPMASRSCSIDAGPRRRSSVMVSLSRHTSRNDKNTPTVEEIE